MSKEPTGDTWTAINEFPECDFDSGVARYEAISMIDGLWHYMCPKCFVELGTGLGLGHGQELILRETIHGQELILRETMRDVPRLKHTELTYLYHPSNTHQEKRT